ncbi:MAG: methyltransferase domain-containing protein [Microlunatus sp.]|nr:methyltransferase domain-containing protein [Microlunatus sp.]MDN5770678.1 methyltransferase domain-containing protein [Microlunatus sp.]
MPDLRSRRSVSQAVLVKLLSAELTDWSRRAPGRVVVDLGGGTGGMAMDLASAGYRVKVVDPSPDALAALERRTAEQGLIGRVSGIQGDASDLVDLVGAAAADVVVCHRVLEVLDDPVQALAAIQEVVSPGGALSLLAGQRHAAVLTQALGGHLAQARRTWVDPDRLDRDRILELVLGAGFAVRATHGIGAVADHVSETLLDAEPGAYADLLALETEIATDPAFQALAPQLHVFAVKGDGVVGSSSPT